MRSTVVFYEPDRLETVWKQVRSVRPRMRGLGISFHTIQRTTGPIHGGRGAHIPPYWNTWTMLVRATALDSATNPRKTMARRVQSASRRYPKPPGSLPESKAATSAGREATHEKHRSAGVPRAAVRGAKHEQGLRAGGVGARARAYRGPAIANTTRAFAHCCSTRSMLEVRWEHRDERRPGVDPRAQTERELHVRVREGRHQLNNQS